MSIEWTGGDPDQMADMGVIGDSPYQEVPEEDPTPDDDGGEWA